MRGELLLGMAPGDAAELLYLPLRSSSVVTPSTFVFFLPLILIWKKPSALRERCPRLSTHAATLPTMLFLLGPKAFDRKKAQKSPKTIWLPRSGEAYVV
jgi:hypothetical protein